MIMFISKSSIKLAFILLVVFCFVKGQGSGSGAVVGGSSVYCTTGGFCTDANCGSSGIVQNNWQSLVGSTTDCVIADCTQLLQNVSNNACYSCNNGISANIYASSDKTQCVTFKKTNAQMLTVCLFVLITFLL